MQTATDKGVSMTAFCTCENPIFDCEHDAGCRRCGLTLDFTPAESVPETVTLADDARGHEAIAGSRQPRTFGDLSDFELLDIAADDERNPGGAATAMACLRNRKRAGELSAWAEGLYDGLCEVRASLVP